MNEDSAPASARWGGAPLATVLVLAGVYAVVTFWLSSLRLEEFTTTNWDLGIFEQALGATLHGHPFYEAGDWEFYGTRSFLQVHPAFALYLLEPFYALSPTPALLFAVQSGAAAAAAIPIYLIARRIVGRPWASVGLAGSYLLSAPLLIANLYDFHLELFLPLEISLLFYCWISERYRLGTAVALLAMVTLEVAPFLVAALTVAFLLPSGRTLRARLLPRARAPDVESATAPASLRTLLRSWLRDRRHRWSLALLVVSGVAYGVLRAIEWYVLPSLLPPAPLAAFGPSVATAGGSGVGLGLTFDFSVNLAGKVGYWLLLVALFGFLPLLAPRILLLELPWFAYTVQSNNFVWTTLGFQYSAVSVAPLAIAAVYGFARAEKELFPAAARWFHARLAGPGPGRRIFRWRAPTGSAGSLRLPTIVLAVVLLGAGVANVYVGPLNPAKQRLNSGLPGFNVRYSPPPGYSNVVQLADLIPAQAPLLASANLFPFVAGDLKAYSLLWVPSQPPQLPFSAGNPPPFFLLASDQGYAVPAWLTYDISLHLYGLYGVVWVTPVGTVYLWKLAYTGPTTVIGPASN